jgi:hypothetical protein
MSIQNAARYVFHAAFGYRVTRKTVQLNLVWWCNALLILGLLKWCMNVLILTV